MSDPDKQPIPVDKIKNLVFDVIVDKLKVDKTSLSESSDIKNDMKADDSKATELKMEIEKVFGISIKDEDKSALTTAGKIINYIDMIFNN
jgi:acyl carrier protein